MEIHVIQMQGDLTFCLIPVDAFDNGELREIEEAKGRDDLCPECLAEMQLTNDDI